MTYKLIENNECILRNDGTIIPPDKYNTDYQEYLKWLAEGNIPEPADQQGEE